MRGDTAELNQHPKAQFFSLGRGEPAPTAKTQNHVCTRQGRSIKNALQILSIPKYE